MTQDTQAGAGAQPAPAEQLAAAASTLERLGYTYRGGAEWAPPLGRAPDFNLLDAANDRIAQLEAEGSRLQSGLDAQRMITDRAIALGKESDAKLSAAQAEAKHWRSNHDNVVARLRIFTQRPDIPKELADRLPWYRELVRLQAVEAQALQQSAEITDAEIDRIAESMPGGLDGFLKAWGWRQFARAILQAAPPAPAAVAVPDEGAMFEAWVRTHEDAHGAFDDWSARAGWEARAALAAAPAQAVAVRLGSE